MLARARAVRPRLPRSLSLNARALSPRQFLAATMTRNTFLKEENLRRVFDQLDADNSSFISVENLAQVLGSEDHAREVIAEADITKDGVISFDEFRQIMERLEGEE